ncbi:histidine kinase [Paenibacillus sp. WQ 127069]|uniref:Histidine kinase n=1 Tax=Paenibacillus baimaensis TaxID=2982185 RepID=A0ABT2U9U6_9BACL|nr:histidine kinase [Paenibacillus sp. WQ 127069]MCU6791416.1 histidine kinase [Paenibacillus sp. WQ 127069]
MRLLTKMTLMHKLLLIVGISTLMIFSLQIYYYSKFYGLTEDKENVHTSKILKQVEEKVISYAQDIKDAALASSYNTMTHDYLSSDDPIYRLRLNKIVIEIMSGIKASNKNIQSIMIVDKNNNILGALNPEDYVVLEEFEKKYSLPVFRSQTKFFGKVFNSEKMERPAYFFYHSISSTLNSDSTVSDLGKCIVVYKTEILDQHITNIKNTPNSLLMILDNESHIVTADESSMKGTFFDKSIFGGMEGDSREHQVEYRQKLNHVQINEIELLDWRIVSMIPINEMTDELRAIRNSGFMIGTAMTLLILVMGLLFIRSVTLPFGRIIRFVNFIGNNDGKQRLKMSIGNEMGFLAIEINRMLDRVDEANEQLLEASISLYQMELAKKQAELASLQSQINPHFLYNTLECVRSIGLANRVMEIVEIATSMAKIFRYSIKEDHFVQINNEMDCIQDYMRIMTIRFTDKFSEHISIEDNVLSMRIPRMILQPIVENAIYHGLERKNGKGILTIKGWVTVDNVVRFEIADNGKGIPAAELHKLRQRLQAADIDQSFSTEKGLGLLNIQRRIKLAFGEPYGIEVNSIENEGTQVSLQIPISFDEQPAER